MYFWGSQAAFPNLKLSDVFTDEGVKVANDIYSNKCMHAASDTFNFNYGSNFTRETQIKSKLAWRMPQKYCPIYFLRSLSDFSNIWRQFPLSE
jgi:hypothetical protein